MQNKLPPMDLPSITRTPIVHWHPRLDSFTHDTSSSSHDSSDLVTPHRGAGHYDDRIIPFPRDAGPGLEQSRDAAETVTTADRDSSGSAGVMRANLLGIISVCLSRSKTIEMD